MVTKRFKPMMMANSRKRLVFKNILIGNHFLTLLALYIQYEFNLFSNKAGVVVVFCN